MVLMEFSMVPLGEGTSVSAYVARCVDIIDRSGLDYEVHAMGTIIEGSLSDVLGVLNACFDALAGDCERVTCTAKFDYRRGQSGRLTKKIASVESKLGRPIRTSHR